MSDLDLPERLTAARAARHKLLTGMAVVEVDQGGGFRTKFTPANREALESYIAELEDSIAGKRRRGAIGVVF
jgi:hypothetical protein